MLGSGKAAYTVSLAGVDANQDGVVDPATLNALEDALEALETSLTTPTTTASTTTSTESPDDSE